MSHFQKNTASAKREALTKKEGRCHAEAQEFDPVPIFGEMWLDVVGYEGLYKISTAGRLWSVRACRVMSPSNADNGYSRVNLVKKDDENPNPRGIRIGYVHRLVASAFIPNPDGLPWVNHKNGVKSDNRVDNLEWGTIEYNHIHAYRTGLHVSPKGSKTGSHKIVESQAMEIFLSSDSHISISKKYGISKSVIRCIKNKTAWKHIHG